MNAFDAYLPSKWLDGIFIKKLAHKPKVEPHVKRGGKWVTVASIGLLTASVAVGSVSSAATPTYIIETYGQAVPSAPPQTLDQRVFVSPGFWQKLDIAIKAAPRLPEQDISGDPVILV